MISWIAMVSKICQPAAGHLLPTLRKPRSSDAAGARRHPTLTPSALWTFLVPWLFAVGGGDRLAAAEPSAKPDLPIAELKRDNAVDFEKEILPIFRNNCLACHNTTKAKASLNLETPQLILKGGDTGPAVIPGKSAESLLFKAAAHLDPELIMPPKDNKANAANCSPEQLALIRLWIDQGARGEVHGVTAVPWLEKPPILDPILAVDVTSDGRFTACSRGSRVDVYHVPSGRHVARLTDPKLTAAGLTNAAHHDLVNALDFNPQGDRLATAGYRDVKIWRQPRDAQDRALTNVGVGSFAISADRQWLAAPTSVHDIRLVALGTDKIVRVLQGHSNQVTALVFSPDSRQLASVSRDQTVRLWLVADGTLIRSATLPCPQLAIAWLNESQELAMAGLDGVIRIGAITNLDASRELKGPAGAVNALAASATGKEFVSAGDDGVARLWDAAGTIRRQFTQEVAVASAALSGDGRRLALAGTNAVTKLWDTESGRVIAQLKGDRHADDHVADRDRALVIAKADVAFHKKSLETAEADLKKTDARIAKATETNTVTEKIFLEKEKALRAAADAKSGAAQALTNLLAEIERVTTTYEKADKASKEAASRASDTANHAIEAQLAADRAAASKVDAEKIAADTANVASRTKAAAANVDAGRETARRIAEESAAVAEKSRAFADAVIADAEMKSKLAVEARLGAKKAIDEVAALAFAAGQLKPNYDRLVGEAPEKRKQATNQVDSTTKAFTEAEKEFKRAETRKSVTSHELELATAAGLRASNVVSGARSTATAAEAALKESESALEQARQRAAIAQKATSAIAFSPDSRTLATLGIDGRVHTWSAETGAPFEVFPREVAPGTNTTNIIITPSNVAFLDADHLLATTATERVTSWNLNPAWILERTLGTGEADSIFADRVNAVRFSPDGQTLATGGGEPTRSGEIKFFNVADGKLQRELADVHSDAVLSIDFAPDGKNLASSSADRFVKVVDLTTGKVVKAFEGHTSYVLGVAWKRDSRTLVSAGADKVIKVWDFVTGDRRKNIDGADKDVTGVAFVGVTDQLIATSGDSQVRLLKETGEKIRSFEGATDFMNSAAATPDGRVVIAGGQDGRLHIWDGTDGKKVASIEPGN